MIKVIAFDLDDTLWAVRPTIINAEKRLNDWLTETVPELRYDVTSMRDLRGQVLKTDPSLTNRITEFRRCIIERALLLSEIPPAKATSLSEQAMSIFLTARNEVVFFDGALTALAELSGQYILGALTNGNADIKRLGLDRYFSFSFSAEQVGAPKPANNLFNTALQHTNTEPRQMVYVGDDPINDIDAANGLGLHTVWIRNSAKEKKGDTQPDESIAHVSHLPSAIERLIKRLEA